MLKTGKLGSTPLLRSMSGSLLGLAGIALVSGCAPDAWTNVKATGFNQFLNTVQAACYYDPISSTTVGNLLQPGGNDNSDYFFDVTSRLYYGKLSPAQWTDMVTSQLQANPTDRGIECFLDEYALDKNKPKSAGQ
jgi:hypothetical protein